MPNRQLIRELQAIVGKQYVLHAPEDLLVYEYDATIERGLPEVVVLPTTAQQVADVVKVARRHDLPVVARGAGTGLSGGAIPARGGVTIDNQLKLFGEAGGALLQTIPDKFPPLAARDHAGHLHHFIDCVLGRDKPINTPQDGLNMIRMLMAVYQSAQTGAEVRLD